MSDIFEKMKKNGLSDSEISLNAYYLIYIKRRM